MRTVFSILAAASLVSSVFAAPTTTAPNSHVKRYGVRPWQENDGDIENTVQCGDCKCNGSDNCSDDCSENECSNSCTPYDTVVNPSFNYYFANWTVTTDPQPPPDQAGQLYIVTGQGYPDGQVYNDGDWTEYTEVSLRVAEWNPTVTTDDGDVSAQLVQWVPVCSDTSYYFQIAFDSGSSVITSGDCSLGLLLGSDPESEVWSDWTDITGYEASGPLLSSNTYTTGDDEVAIPITIDLYCSPEANFEDGNIRVHVDSVSLQVDE